MTGFCTPGIIVSIYSLYANSYSLKEIEEHLDGNLCRCTGYRPIWDAARSLCDDAEDLVRGPCGTPCRQCPERDECQEDCNVKDKETVCGEGTKDKVVCSSSKDKMAMKKVFVENKDGWLDQPNEMFPKELADASSIENQELGKPLIVVDHTAFHGAGTWFKPNSLEDLLALLREFGGPDGGGYKIVVGNTEVGIGKINVRHLSGLNLLPHLGPDVNITYYSSCFIRNKIQACTISSTYFPGGIHRRTLSIHSRIRQSCFRCMHASE